MGRPKKSQRKSNAGRPTLFTEETKKKLLTHLEEGLPKEVCADLCDMHHETLRQYTIRNPDFLAQMQHAEAIGIRRLHALVLQQNGAWKILKNVGKKYYKEHVEVHYDESKPITIHGIDEESEAI